MGGKKMSRRAFLKNLAYGGGAAGVAAAAGAFSGRGRLDGATVWQIDPEKCSACGRCLDSCVRTTSAVKCVHAYAICGYCDLCSAYLRPGHLERNTAAENLQCPTAAIKRTFVEDPYYEYVIDEELCVACGKCVKACGDFGNGSLFLQIKQELCLNCNQCRIAANCPSGAVSRVPADAPYIVKGAGS